ncbi:MAG: radical SAM protein [Bacteroidetes bacterium]|nr:radical SAM protein [Bacteroidota bacterium]
MKTKVLLILPPFTQLNTPYPSTAYLKGFLNTQNIQSIQCDLGLEVILKIFTAQGLKAVFEQVHESSLSENAARIYSLRECYIQTVDEVMRFLQHKNATLAHAICENDFLPRAARFKQLEDLEWAFGTMGQQDKARHLATLYLDDLADLISETVDPHFGFSRYAERLGRCANTFDELDIELQKDNSYISRVMLEILAEKMNDFQPDLVALSVPFPGNLLGGLKCGQWIKTNYPSTRVALGGGFANTELRSLHDSRVFNYVDFITLDDGEAPVLNLVQFLEGSRSAEKLKRTFVCQGGMVTYIDASDQKDFSQAECGVPDYAGLKLDQYLSVIELANPMHSLWSNGRWNKLTLAHGCYWGKCTFCDTSLDYIKRYEQTAAPLICDRMQHLIAQTGEIGFHFVDEAAPPGLLRDLAIEILRRKMNVVWWTNIRFEKSFTRDLCFLLKASGCIAMSGGLEVASDRLLALIDKGVTVAQVANVCRNFSEAGILVHAYLMYGYPTQTEQETVDSLEMVRQLFESGIMQSAFWHRFAMTAHSPVGMNPQKYKTQLVSSARPTFANNDLFYTEEVDTDHEQFSDGLKKSLFNYMRGLGFDLSLQAWFEQKIPRTKIAENYIQEILQQPEDLNTRPTAKLIYTGLKPQLEHTVKTKKSQTIQQARLRFIHNQGDESVTLDRETGNWLYAYFDHFLISTSNVLLFKEFKADFEKEFPGEFENFWLGEAGSALRLAGLLIV